MPPRSHLRTPRGARPLALGLAVWLTGITPAAAQRLYRFELSGGPSFHTFDKVTDLSTSVGGTVRAGYWVHVPLGVEVEADFTSPSTKSTPSASVGVRSLSASAVGNLAIGKFSSAYLRLGYASVSYGSCPAVSTPNSPICGSAGAIQGAVGGRLALSPTFMLRAEGLLSRSQATLKFSNLSIHAGISLMLGSEPLVDTDADGVYDRYDRCPSTPLGSIVDRRGCATDTDKDGVYDGLDRCPDTPSGAIVDKVGCPSDSDSDGVQDGIDRCPDTPPGAAVDSTGCSPDSDKDGVPDGLDRCQGTPPGAVVDKLGCPSDADNDGVPDGLDRCPNTAPGVTVNLFGCPVNLDSDKDGVPDAVDKCPDTPLGIKVDASGCPPKPALEPAAPAPKPPAPAAAPPVATPDKSPTPTPGAGAGVRSFVVPGSAFPLQSAKLQTEAYSVLDSVVTMMLSNPFLKVEIGGHAQDRMVPGDNQKLSVQRAEAVRSYLVSKGIPATRLQVKGFGSGRPLVTDTTDTGRIQNRRVEIRPI